VETDRSVSKKRLFDFGKVRIFPPLFEKRLGLFNYGKTRSLSSHCLMARRAAALDDANRYHYPPPGANLHFDVNAERQRTMVLRRRVYGVAGLVPKRSKNSPAQAARFVTKLIISGSYRLPCELLIGFLRLPFE
jgi:hypothetical protein